MLLLSFRHPNNSVSSPRQNCLVFSQVFWMGYRPLKQFTLDYGSYPANYLPARARRKKLANLAFKLLLKAIRWPNAR